MFLNLLKCKLHGARVTDANLDYEGSIEIDEELIRAAGLRPFEQVHVLNVTNGERIETYVIVGPPGSKRICLNGAAARKAERGDKVLVLSYVWLEEKELASHKPRVVVLDDANEIVTVKDHSALWPEE